jgi:hypothetical protein
MGRAETLITSHALFFMAGFAAGKFFDRDELNSYRNAYEKPMERFRRYAGNAVLGAAGLGAIYVMTKITRIATRKVE